MFFDEDGYLAHEFYEETRVCTDDRASTRGGVARGERGSGAGGKGGKTSTVRWTMKRVIKNLVPQVYSVTDESKHMQIMETCTQTCSREHNLCIVIHTQA